MSYMLGGVSLDMLLDSDLGNVLDLMMDLVSHMVSHGHSGDLLDKGCSVLNMLNGNRGSPHGSHSGGSLNLDSLHSWSCNGLDGLDSHWSSILYNRGLDSNSLANWVNKSILVEVFGKSLK